ncbi:MAG: phosphate signaling complex protein PhoU [Phycisphaerales bacterium]
MNDGSEHGMDATRFDAGEGPNIGAGGLGGTEGETTFEASLRQLKRRLIREATMATGMLEAALRALWPLDADAARAVRRDDDAIDMEEVAIETACYELLALHHPFARDFRVVTFILKVNSDIERMADHATSIAKVVIRISKLHPNTAPPKWPTALVELAQRVPGACHELLRSVLNEDVDGARQIVLGDEVIDDLERQLFEEVVQLTRAERPSDEGLSVAMLLYRIGRELERIGDLMKNIAEDVIYLSTGTIVRHEKRRLKQS